MRYALVNLVLVATTAFALPNNIMLHGKNRTRHGDVSKPSMCLPSFGLIHTRPKCCRGDILGLAHRNCGTPDPFPANVTGFVNSCLENGKAAQCCVGTIHSISFLCHSPTITALESRGLAQSDGNDTVTPSAAKVTKKLSVKALNTLARSLFPYIKTIEKSRDGVIAMKVKVEDVEMEFVAQAFKKPRLEEPEDDDDDQDGKVIIEGEWDDEEEEVDGTVIIEASPSSTFTKNPSTAAAAPMAA